MNLSSLNYIAEGIRVKPGATDVLHEMAMGVRSCTSRIKDILGEEGGQRVIDGLNAEIELQREDHLVPFAWDLSMYRNPPVNWDTAQPFNSTSNALLAGVREEAEAIVRMEDAGGPINKDMANCKIGDYLVCVSNPSDPLSALFGWDRLSKAIVPRKSLKCTGFCLQPSTLVAAVRGLKGEAGKRKTWRLKVLQGHRYNTTKAMFLRLILQKKGKTIHKNPIFNARLKTILTLSFGQ